MNSLIRPGWGRLPAVLACAVVICGITLTAAAVPTLTVEETAGDYYTVTAHDGDGDVDLDDFVILKQNFGT